MPLKVRNVLTRVSLKTLPKTTPNTMATMIFANKGNFVLFRFITLFLLTFCG